MEMILTSPTDHPVAGVVELWSLNGRIQGMYSGLPKPYVEMIISLSGNHFWRVGEQSDALNFKDGWVTPIQSGPRFAETLGPLHLVGARLTIEAAVKLFGPVINRDSGPPIPLESLIGSQAELLREQLLELKTESLRMACLGGWVSQRLQHVPSFPLPTLNALAGMGWRADTLADYLGLSSRGLRKRFNRQLGVGPKFWLQLHRFDALLKADVSNMSLAQVAAAFGYTDQAHMTTDFKRFAGRSPQDYLSTRKIALVPDAAPHFLPGRS
ncbi:MAG: helix-turn-helix domain-containing protein [Lysobacterales bacterium]